MSFRDSLVAEVVVECDECGNELPVTAVSLEKNQIHISLGACRTCLENAESKGEETGYDKGYSDGQEAAEEDEE